MTAFYGFLYWPYNPHFYRLSHQKFHHRYTLHQGSDGEDVPNYVELTPRLVGDLFLFPVLAHGVPHRTPHVCRHPLLQSQGLSEVCG